MAEVVRYVALNMHNVIDILLDTAVIENGTALGLYNVVKSILCERTIPLENIIGFAENICSSIMDTKSRFLKLQKDDVSSVCIIESICHSFTLHISHAVSTRPSYLKAFVKYLTSYFSHSSKRQ